MKRIEKPYKAPVPQIDSEMEWYSQRSKQYKLPPRCPIASVHLCPRYYLSLFLLGKEGFTTKMDDKENRRLLEQWKKSTHFPPIAEEEPSVSFTNGKFSMIAHFCPEVSYDMFGVFASHVAHYADDIDIAVAHKHLRTIGADLSDWRWSYSHVNHTHYTECKEFSAYLGSDLISGIKKSRKQSRSQISPKVRWGVFSRDKFTCQYCGAKPPSVPLELDHKIPKSKGGTDDAPNLITACLNCNRGKSNQMPPKI